MRFISSPKHGPAPQPWHIYGDASMMSATCFRRHRAQKHSHAFLSRYCRVSRRTAWAAASSLRAAIAPGVLMKLRHSPAVTLCIESSRHWSAAMEQVSSSHRIATALPGLPPQRIPFLLTNIHLHVLKVPQNKLIRTKSKTTACLNITIAAECIVVQACSLLLDSSNYPNLRAGRSIK